MAESWSCRFSGAAVSTAEARSVETMAKLKNEAPGFDGSELTSRQIPVTQSAVDVSR